MAGHVHHHCARGMQLLDHPFRGDADRADEEWHLFFDHDVDYLPELAACVVRVRLPGVASDLWKQEVNSEWQRPRYGIAGLELQFELPDARAQALCRHPDGADGTDAARIGHRC